MCITLVVWCFVLAFKWTRAICAGAFAVGSVTVGIAAYGQRGKVKSDSHTFFTAAKQDFAIHILSRLGNSSRLKLEDDFVDVKHVSVYTMFYISLFPIWILFWCLMMFFVRQVAVYSLRKHFYWICWKNTKQQHMEKITVSTQFCPWMTTESTTH